MKQLMAIIFFILFASNSFASSSWTDDNWQGAGVDVDNVYIQWDNKWIVFGASDGNTYYYPWGTSDEPTERAKMKFSMLLTAFSANKKVSVYRSNTPSNSNWYEFTMLNLHD